MGSPSVEALERTSDLLTVRWESVTQREPGYLDTLDEDPAPTGFAQRLMGSRLVPVIYERWWRPFLARIAKGPSGPSMSDERHLAARLLDLREGRTVVDLACGTGSFTRHFARTVGSTGFALGVDVSHTMLSRAVTDTDADNVVYLRADATALPLRPASVDAVCCFAAFHLFPEPWRALDEMVRVVRPGGRVALLTSSRLPGPLGPVGTVVGTVSGMRIFEPEEITGALVDRGLDVVEHRTTGAMQIVAGRAG